MRQQIRMSASNSNGSNGRRVAVGVGGSVVGGRGVGLQPRTPNVSSRPHTPSAPAATAAANLQVPPPRPIIAFQIVQQCQEFLIQLAWQEVRGMATMTIAEQKDKMLECYTRFVPLFLNSQIPAANSCYPTCPEALRNGDRTAAVALLHQSTQTGRSSLSKDALYRKAKKGTQKLLKYMGDWTRICKDPNTIAGQFVPSVPPSGHDRDWVWTKIKSTEHRSSECLKIWKRRQANRHLAENTDEAVREALTHMIFATRGFSLEEEMQLRSGHEEQNLNEADALEYGQIMEEVEAGLESGVIVDNSDDENSAPTSRTATQTTAAPRGYFETPYCEVQGCYHLFELAAKAFTQYAGNGHENISIFYTSEWADHQRTQASLGGTGRTQQRRVQHAERVNSASESRSSSVVSRSEGAANELPSQTSAASLTSSSNHHIDQLTQQMQRQNAISQHSRILSSMEKAISLAQAMKKPSSEVKRLQQRCLDYLEADINRELPALPVSHRAHQPVAATEPSLPRATRRRRELNESQTSALEQIQALGNIVENPGDGDCLFYCLAAIENDFLEVRASNRPRNAYAAATHQDMRAEVVETLRADSALVRVATVRDILGGNQHAIFAEGDMEQQKGSVQGYCDWMQQDGICGRYVRTLNFLAPCAHTLMTNF